MDSPTVQKHKSIAGLYHRSSGEILNDDDLRHQIL